MTRRKKILLAIGFLLFAVLVIAWFAVPHEPSHQGRPLSDWIKDFESPDYTVRLAAQEAIRAMGPKAVPFLTRSLEQRNSASLQFYRRNIGRSKFLSALRQRIKMHQPVMESRNAAAALAALGPEAEPAIPNLVAALNDYSPVVAQEAAKTLGNMPHALPRLIERLRAGPANDTIWVVRTLTSMGPVARDAAPELARFVKTTNPLGDFSVIALARIGAPAIPFMTNFLSDSNLTIRLRASSFFWQLGTNAIFATNVLLQAADDPNPNVRLQVWNALGASLAPPEMTRPIWLAGIYDPIPANAVAALYNLSNDHEAASAHSNEIAEVFRTNANAAVRERASNVLTELDAWPKK